MGFWGYFRSKLLGIGAMFLGVAVMAIGAYLITQFGVGKNVFELNLDALGCASGVLIVIVGGIAIAFGQQKLKKLDE